MRKYVSVIALIALIAVSCTSTAKVESNKYQGPYHMVVLGTTDMHANVWGYSYEDNKESSNNGIARVYSYIKEVRSEFPSTILIDNGDLIQGTILSDDLANKNLDDEHPVIAAMNFMEYDAATLGNHEFNWGIDTMLSIEAQAKYPVIAANVKNADGSYTIGSAYTIIERDGLRIGIIGVVTPDVPIWDGGKQGIDETIFEAANVAVRNAISEIRDKVDVIIVTAHMGLPAEFHEDSGADSAQKILDDNPEIDILHVGHFHIVVSEKQGMTVIGGARNSGRDVVRYDLYLDENKNIVGAAVAVVDMKDYEPSEEIRSIPAVKKYHEAAIALVAGGVGEDGEAAPPLGSTTERFQPENEIKGIPQGKLEDSAVMDLINKIQLENSGADVSAAALFKNTSDLPAGNINYGNIFDIYKYDNTLYRVPVTGAELKAYMEWSAECYNQWEPGDINISFDPEYPDFLYDMFAGVDYEIDLSQPKGQRIKNVMFKGQPLKDDDKLTLAVNNYRYSSALKSQKLVVASREWESSNSIRDMLVKYFAENSPVAPEVDNNWRIVGVDLSLDDPRRAEIIELINSGKLPTPYADAYNLADYDNLIKEAGTN